MKNKHYFSKALFATLVALFFAVSSFAQCTITVTDGSPYIEGFEGDGFECWDIDISGGGSWEILQGTNSTVVSFSYHNNGDEGRLISPVLDLSAIEAATFSFTYAMMGIYQNDELEVCYRSSESDEWHVLATYSLSDYQNFFEDTFELENLSATYQVSFLGRGLGGMYIFVDNIEIASNSSCSRPVSLQASDITATSALLGWSTTGNEESWTVEFEGNEFDVTTQPFLMEGLRPQTQYTYRVRANCGEGNVSDWAIPISFTTLCDVITVTDETPYFDDFEASEDFLCWQTEIGSGTDGWVIDPGYLILNNTAFFIWLGGDALLISAPLDITAVTHPTLAFKHKQLQNANGVDELSVWYRTTETESWQELERYPNATNQWEQVVMELPNPSATYQIAFMGVGNNGEGIYVDDVEVGDSSSVGLMESSSVTASVSPNPTTGSVKVETNAADGEVVVFDLFGRQMKSAALHEGHAELDLGTFAKGVYVVRIASESGMTTIKLVKE